MADINDYLATYLINKYYNIGHISSSLNIGTRWVWKKKKYRTCMQDLSMRLTLEHRVTNMQLRKRAPKGS